MITMAPIREKTTMITVARKNPDRIGNDDSISADNPAAVTKPETITSAPSFRTVSLPQSHTFLPPRNPS
jgi:hypothetical protein